MPLQTIRKTARFLKEFAASPGTTGAIAPSSRRLSCRLLDPIDFSQIQTIVEYGPGTGSFTQHILPRLSSANRFFAVELNSGFCKSFRKHYPEVTLYQDCVTNIRKICDQEKIEHVDCVVSGLPWAAFDGMLQDNILEAMLSVLRPGGHFVTFAYLHGLALPNARKFRKKLEGYFSEVSISRPVWINLPPALCYNCTR